MPHLGLYRLGSPPHMRGKGIVHVFVPEKLGITPAYAGKRQHPVQCPLVGRDHPRVCGEKVYKDIKHVAAVGSPPRMRGKDGVNDSAQAVTGITPACAGKRELAAATKSLCGDHPRVCGEKNSLIIGQTGLLGSPPRVRGKVKYTGGQKYAEGITPAYAGKRDFLGLACGWVRDHPRVCGEKVCGIWLKCASLGSPPRMRGKAGRCREHDAC